jgi:thiosulfate/3-mercaptopyruvate sulfurtransferase
LPDACNADATTGAISYGAVTDHTTLISTETLASHLADPSWIVADCRYNLNDEAWGRTQYRAGHIAGAIFVNLAHDLAGERTGSNGRHPLPPVEAIAETFGHLGIGRAAQVVAYDQDAGAYASRLWWMLRYLGHDAVAVLDGGWAKWAREGRPTNVGEEGTRTPTSFTAKPRQEMHVTVDEAARRAEDPGVIFIDARSPQRFQGQPDPLDKVPGHIPGARNRFYRDNLTADGTLRSADALRADFDRVLDGRSANEIVMYCGSGITACHNLLAMEHAGLHGMKLYSGSWSEWESDPRRPVETGPAKITSPGHTS